MDESPDTFVPIDEFLDTAKRLGEAYLTPPGGTLRMELVEPSLISERVLEEIAAFRVACQWHRHWLDGVAIGDSQAFASATGMLLDIPGWPIFAGTEEMWQQFVVRVDQGVIDGPRDFTASNCSEVRDELPPPNQIATITATFAVVFADNPGPIVTPSARPETISRIGNSIPLPDGTSFGALEQASHSEPEVALRATLQQNAWCQWLGRLIDAGESGDQPTAESVLAEMLWFVQPNNAQHVDSATSRGDMEYVIETARVGNGYWAVADYRNNCFAIDSGRDALLNGDSHG